MLQWRCTIDHFRTPFYMNCDLPIHFPCWHVFVSVCCTGECISGALQWKELMKMATEIGFAPPVLVSSTLYTCQDKRVADMLGEPNSWLEGVQIQILSHLESSECSGLQFCSATYRLMKVDPEPAQDGLEAKEEPLVEVVYKGACVMLHSHWVDPLNYLHLSSPWLSRMWWHWNCTHKGWEGSLGRGSEQAFIVLRKC